MSKQPSGDDVRKHLEQSRELGKEMSRTADEIVRSLRRAADGLRRSAASSNQS